MNETTVQVPDIKYPVAQVGWSDGVTHRCMDCLNENNAHEDDKQEDLYYSLDRVVDDRNVPESDREYKPSDFECYSDLECGNCGKRLFSA